MVFPMVILCDICLNDLFDDTEKKGVFNKSCCISGKTNTFWNLLLKEVEVYV